MENKTQKSAEETPQNELPDDCGSVFGKARRLFVRTHGLSLQLMLSVVVFVIILVTMTIISSVTLMLLHLGVIGEPAAPAFPPVLLLMAVLSTAIGTVLSFLFGRIPLRPLHRVIDAMRRVADGDFSARLNVRSGKSEINQLYQSFNTMTEELQSVEILRKDFINSFSHEFKTPIVSIRGFARMLKNPGLSEKERDEYLNIIISESERLANLSTNILNLSRLEKQKIVSDASLFCLSEQLRCCILVLQYAWEKKHLEIDAELEDFDYYGSENLLSQVWMNLLDNAVKFSPENTTISVSLHRIDGNPVCRIKNAGPPISQKGLSRIFEKFYQEDPSRASSGNGLGLSIVNKIVSLHRGCVSVQNIPDGGVEFTVKLSELPGGKK